MSFVNFPLSEGQFWGAPVDTVGDLPATGSAVGEVRAILDTQLAYMWDGATWLPAFGGGGGGGDVNGPASATDNAVTRFNGTSGKAIQNSGVILDDSNNVSGINDLAVTGTTTLATGLTGVAKLASGVVSAGSVNLSSETTGILPVAKGGTNSNTALSNNRVMQSSAGAIVEAAAISASRALVSDANGIPTHSAVTSTELGYVSGVTSAIQTQLDGKQATGNYITALTGDVTASGPGSAASTIANGAITNAKVASGAAIAVNKLAALTAARAVVLDGSGFLSASAVTSTELGYLSGVTSALQTQIDSKVSKAGDTMTGLLTLSGDPSTALQAATKQYVDNIAQGLSPKAPVLVATTANITLLGEQTIDGVLTSASRVLVKNQTLPAENGIYVSGAGAWTRSTDMDAWSEVPGAYVFVEQGTLYADTGWVCTSDPGGTLGVTAITFVQFAGAGTYTADGLGLKQTGTQFYVSLDSTTLSQSASGLKVATGGITNTEVAAGAAIARTKLASGSINRLVSNDGSGVMSDLAAITASRALASDSNGLPVASATTATELGYVSGVTSAIQTQLNNKMGKVLPTNIQEVFVNSLQGSDVTGTGAYDAPWATIAFACTQITDSSSNKPYAIRLCGARQNETQDVLLPPYVNIHGPGQRAAIIRGVSTNRIKPSAAHATGTSWNCIKDVYISSTIPINWDLQAVGGSNNVLVLENITCGGSFTYKGRAGGGGDFAECYSSLIVGATTLDSVSAQIQNMDLIGAVSVTDTQSANQSATFLNVAFDTGLTTSKSISLWNCSFPGTSSVTTTAAVTLSSYKGLPPTSRRTLFSGTTVTNYDDPTLLPFTPTTSGNWATQPTNVQEGLDYLAAEKMPKTGGTFTGPVDFSGASTTVRMPNLTTTQRNALTPAAGMEIYNTTANTVQVYVAGSVNDWVDALGWGATVG